MINHISNINELFLDIINIISSRVFIVKAIEVGQIASSVALMGMSFYKNRIKKKILINKKDLRFEYLYFLALRCFVFLTTILTAIKVLELGTTPRFFLYTNIIFLFLYSEGMFFFDSKIYRRSELKFEESMQLLDRSIYMTQTLEKENDELRSQIKKYEQIIKGEKNER